MIKPLQEGEELKAKLEHIFVNDEDSLSKLIEVYIRKCEGLVTYDKLILYFVPLKASRKRLDNNLKSLVSHRILIKEIMYEGRVIIYKINESSD